MTMNRRHLLEMASVFGVAGSISGGGVFPLLGAVKTRNQLINNPVHTGERPASRLYADVVVVGGGLSGVCAALAAARNGASVVLVQDRPVLGGNSSSEVRMHVCGADNSGGRQNQAARESGIVEELRLENQVRNPQRSAAMWDLILWEKVYFQRNLTLLLNTVMTHCRKDNGLIRSISCYQFRTETFYEIEASYFIDCTGDGTLGYIAGNPYRVGQEAKAEFGESLAPEKATPYSLGSSLLFQGRDFGRPVPFIAPEWAYVYESDDDIKRGHDSFEYGYWWIEWGGLIDTIKDDDAIRFELLKCLFGIWDHIKNRGNHGAENWAPEWFGFLPARRESRRLMGAYILREQDLISGRVFHDEVAYGGWPIDHHYPGGFKHDDADFWYSHKLKNIYSIPLRSLYSEAIPNLFLGGRAISGTHLAFCSIRVMATCAVMGQGAGTAAAYCADRNVLPRELSTADIGRIKQTLLRDDAYLPGTANGDPADLARTASVSAGSEVPGYDAKKVIDGVAREMNGDSHQWRPASLRPDDAWLQLDFAEPVSCRELHLSFDTNFLRPMTLTHEDSFHRRMKEGAQPETVRKYRVEADSGSGWQTVLEVQNNYQRKRVHSFRNLRASKIRIRIDETNGVPEGRIFEVRCYG